MLHDNNGKKNWVTNIKDLLFKYGYGYVWISQDGGHIYMFVSSFKQRLTYCISQNWSDDLSSSSRCGTYCIFKPLLKAFSAVSYCASVTKPQNPGIAGSNPTRGLTFYYFISLFF